MNTSIEKLACAPWLVAVLALALGGCAASEDDEGVGEASNTQGTREESAAPEAALADEEAVAEGEAIGVDQSAVTATYTYYYSRTVVREMFRNLSRLDDFCDALPLPYIGSLLCRVDSGLMSAIRQAYYQGKRVKGVYYSCGVNYCSYTRYYVVT